MELELYKRRTSVLRLDTFAIPETRFPIARLLVEPSFEPDWVVSVYHPEGGKCRIIATVAEKNVYYANQQVIHRMGSMRQQPAKIDATVHEATIPCDAADQVGNAWKTILSHLVPAKVGDPMLLDGVAYTAIRSTDLLGYACGRVGSPPEGSPADRLSTLGATLLNYAQADERSRGRLVSRLRKLAGELALVKPPANVDP